MAQRLHRIHVAAQMAGVPEGLIRAWERRYGLLKPKRTESGYRTYTEEDIEVLRRIRRLTEEGVSIGEAAALAADIRREIRGPARPSVAFVDEQALLKWKDDVLAAAARFDQVEVEAVFDEALNRLPALAVFEGLMIPVSREMGERWHNGKMNVAEEHLVTHAIRSRLLGLIQQTPQRARRHAVCACFPYETHEIGLLGTTLRLRHAGFRVTYLGAQTPARELGAAVKKAKPDVIALSRVVDEGGRAFAAELAALRSELPRDARVVLGGAAAIRHRSEAEEEGFWVVDTDEEWATFLDASE